MSNEVSFRLQIDTKAAQAALQGLTKAAEKEATRTGRGIKSAIGKGLGLVGLGGAVGAGFQAVRGATQSGVADVIGEALGPLGAQIEDFFLGSLNEEARGKMAAREEFSNQFAAIAGAQNWSAIPPQAQGYFNSLASLRTQEEKGRELFRKSTDLHGPGIDDLLKRIMDGIGSLLSSAVTNLGNLLAAPFK